VRKSKPAVVVVTEQFEKLSKIIMKSQNVPESIAIMVKGNPEYVKPEVLAAICERVAEEVIERLTRAHRG
jgi:hypothetical protein